MVIDLKNVNIYFEDGTLMAGAINNLMTGAINNVAGYSIGAVSLLVDGFVGIVPVGSRVTIGANSLRVTSTVETTGNTTTINVAAPGLTVAVNDDDVVTVNGYAVSATTIRVDGFVGIVPKSARMEIGGDDRYTVLSTVESVGNTVSITFTPGLAAIAADNAAITVHGVYLEIKVGDGTITWSEKKPREYIKDRGKLDEVRDGDEEPMDVNINLQYEELTASNPLTDPPTPEDALKKRGAAADWNSTDTTDPCAPFCIDIRIDHIPPNCTSLKKERVILPMFYYNQLDHDPKAGTIVVAGQCNATEAEVTRIAVV